MHDNNIKYFDISIGILTWATLILNVRIKRAIGMYGNVCMVIISKVTFSEWWSLRYLGIFESYDITIEREIRAAFLKEISIFAHFSSSIALKVPAAASESIFLHGSNEHYVFSDVIMGLRD